MFIFFQYDKQLNVLATDETGTNHCLGRANSLSIASQFVQLLTDHYKKERRQRICQQRNKII